MQINFDSMYFKPRNAENLVWGNGEDSLLKGELGTEYVIGRKSEAVAEWDEVDYV